MRFLALTCLLASASFAQGVKSVSGADWKAGPSGDTTDLTWTAADFDDSQWKPAGLVAGPDGWGEHYTLRNCFGRPTDAKWIWIEPEAQKCRFRLRVEVPAGSSRAEMLFVADDFAEVYINGELVETFDTGKGEWGHRGCAAFVDVLPFLKEGANIVAVEAADFMGARGFAAEIVVNGAPLVPALRGKDETLPAKELARVNELIDVLSTGTDGERSAAFAELVRKARELGLALAPALDRAAAATLDGRTLVRLTQVMDAALPGLPPAVDGDGRFAFGRRTADDIRRLLGTDATPATLFRWVVAARVRAFVDPDAMTKVLRKAAEDGTELEAERATRIVAALDVPEHADVLAEVLRARPKTRAGAWAASALSRIGGPEHVKLLEKASTCGYAPTERAAKATLRVIRK